ncbi:ribosome small subunit-dependent GTPase A [Aliiroseovarius sp. PTFE2010]|uniref:ribosome small subunit-dependent GTPase A n=1 Tax=Aliiroseovarius sp. PTFE2010 TaxID=3417190 RepID=UPI003CFA4263
MSDTPPMTAPPTLASLGWSDHFASQCDPDDSPLRLSEVRRNRVVGIGPGGTRELALPGDILTTQLAVGDWVLADLDVGRVTRVLERRAALARKSVSHRGQSQLIAANVDTLVIVTSCNADFNVARLERYVALALEADAQPVIVITKADKAEARAPDDYRAEAEAISPRIVALVLNAKDPAQVQALERWCGPGQTVAMVGSSGVGKSTLGVALTGQKLATADIREDDAKGRHTTTARALLPMKAGGWLIDMPGMRELGLHDVADGIDTLFEELTDLARDCKFRNCEHQGEPGCAIRAAIEAGDISPDRFERWQKLKSEDAHNTETISEQRARGKAFARQVKMAKRAKGKGRKG